MDTHIKTSEHNNCVTIYDETIFHSLESSFFDARYWQQRNALVGQAQGRGTTWFFSYNNVEFVLRHYYRGGLIGRLLNDQYLFLGLTRTRPYREFELLRMLDSRGLPVAKPAAIRIEKRRSLYCTADIITTRIHNAQSLVELLQKQALPPTMWQNIGKTLAEFHRHKVHHHDLNAHNVLIDINAKVWLIDFDQGAIQADHGPWRWANLARLRRSLRKELRLFGDFHWREEDWKKLLSGYEQI